jgi:hypothetical protein
LTWRGASACDIQHGKRVDWQIYDDPRNHERYFAVIADAEALTDIVATAPVGSTSLKQFFASGSASRPALAPASPGPFH